MKQSTSKGFLSLTNDLVFKRYFKSGKPVLKSLLEAFLPLSPSRKITGFPCWTPICLLLSPRANSLFWT